MNLILNAQRNYLGSMSKKLELLRQNETLRTNDHEWKYFCRLKEIIIKYKQKEKLKTYSIGGMECDEKKEIIKEKIKKEVKDKIVCWNNHAKTAKNCKIYRNNKRKYQYNRW